MPIDRPDGRHWCDPASETPDEDGTWTCPCALVWRRHENGIWGLADAPRPLAPGEVPQDAGDPRSEPEPGESAEPSNDEQDGED